LSSSENSAIAILLRGMEPAPGSYRLVTTIVPDRVDAKHSE
jgi:hypothetical protein